jgi:hypothetical protein
MREWVGLNCTFGEDGGQAGGEVGIEEEREAGFWDKRTKGSRHWHRLGRAKERLQEPGPESDQRHPSRLQTSVHLLPPSCRCPLIS